MFQDYMRSRLGLGSVTPEPITTQPMPVQSGPENPPGFNGQPYHPQMNPTGWPGHPMNPVNGGNPPMQPAPPIGYPGYPTQPTQPNPMPPVPRQPVIGQPRQPNPYSFI